MLRVPLTARDKRRGAARRLSFSAVAPLLARTDGVATLPAIVMHDALERHALEPQTAHR